MFIEDKKLIKDLYGIDVYNWTEEVLKEIWKDKKTYYYIDNIRITLVGDINQEKEYNLLYNKGCCGFYDHEFEFKDGRIFKIGFNFGH